MSENAWRINFTVEKPILMGISPQAAANVEEQKGEEAGFSERADIQVEILQVPEQQKYCVKFSRKAGSTIVFYDQANDYLSYLDNCNNETLEGIVDPPVEPEDAGDAGDVGDAAAAQQEQEQE